MKYSFKGTHSCSELQGPPLSSCTLPGKWAGWSRTAAAAGPESFSGLDQGAAAHIRHHADLRAYMVKCQHWVGKYVFGNCESESVKVICSHQQYTWSEGEWRLQSGIQDLLNTTEGVLTEQQSVEQHTKRPHLQLWTLIATTEPNKETNYNYNRLIWQQHGSTLFIS